MTKLEMLQKEINDRVATINDDQDTLIYVSRRQNELLAAAHSDAERESIRQSIEYRNLEFMHSVAWESINRETAKLDIAHRRYNELFEAEAETQETNEEIQARLDELYQPGGAGWVWPPVRREAVAD